jgi:hypothetical protein
MARLEDRGSTGLPRPPAPTRRSSNPWKLSDTARKREEPRPASIQDLLDEIQHQAEEPPPRESPPARKPEPVSWQQPASQPQPAPAPPRESSGPWPLFILLVAVGVIFKIALTIGQGGGNWRMALGPLILLFFVGQAWWRARQRRRRKAEERAAGGG